MSQEDLQKFLEAIRQDTSLQEKLKAEEADPVALAREAGFSVTQAELIRAHASHADSLSDEELENAAGGGYAHTVSCDLSRHSQALKQYNETIKHDRFSVC